MVEILHQVASDMNKLKRQLFCYIAIAARTHCDCLAGDKLQQDICRWLCPPDPWKNHHIARESHHRRGSFKATRSQNGNLPPPSSILWIHGKRGLALTFSQRLMVFRFVAGSGKNMLWYVDLRMFPS